MKILGFAGAVVLLVLAIGVALLAADVRAWHSTMTGDDALLASAPRSASWQSPTHLSSLAERVLGVSDDVRMRRALARFRETVNIVPRLDNAQQVALARSGAEQALAAVARDQPGPRASQAETLLGVLVFTDVQPLTDPFGGTATIDTDQMQASLTDFQDAVRADPDNAAAKYDLELTLRALLAQGVRVGTGKRTGAGATGRHGAGGGAAGGGY